jgi:hypothetical protein
VESFEVVPDVENKRAYSEMSNKNLTKLLQQVVMLTLSESNGDDVRG